MSKILIVDDEPFILMMLEDKFKRAGFGVIALNESTRALDVIRAERPDIVLLDWMMPEVSGIEICKAVKSDPDLASIPVFMLTAKGQEEDERLGMRAGVDRYITKPFSPAAILEMVREVLPDDVS
jgi:two-component system phosphate regulon response regulator PhoB